MNEFLPNKSLLQTQCCCCCCCCRPLEEPNRVLFSSWQSNSDDSQLLRPPSDTFICAANFFRLKNINRRMKARRSFTCRMSFRVLASRTGLAVTTLSRRFSPDCEMSWRTRSRLLCFTPWSFTEQMTSSWTHRDRSAAERGTILCVIEKDEYQECQLTYLILLDSYEIQFEVVWNRSDVLLYKPISFHLPR